MPGIVLQIEDNEIETILNQYKTGKSKKDATVEKKDLIDHLDEIKQQGYALTFGELLDGSIGISAPIHNYFYPVTLSILGSEERLRPKTNHLVEELKASAARISRSLSDSLHSKEGNNVKNE